METAHREIWWKWTEWRGRERVERSKIVLQPYQRYPRTIVNPPGMELQLTATPQGRMVIVDETFRVGREADRAKLAINLLLELFGEAEVLCALYRLERGPAGTEAPLVTEQLDRVTNSNGIDWSPDDRFMYYVDTGTRRIDVFDFDAVSGHIANRRPLVAIDEADGKPDGLIVDVEGGLWVALWQGSAVRRYTPDGRLDRQIDLTVSCPTKCAFGGADLDTLYITSAHKALTEEQRAREPHAGSVFTARPGVRGRAPNRARLRDPAARPCAGQEVN